MNKLLCILLAVSLPVFAEDKELPEDAPQVLRIEEGQLLTEDGPVAVGPGLYLNPSMAALIRDTVATADTENKALVEAVNAAREESERKVDVKTVVIISAITLGLGLIAGGLTVGVIVAATK